MSVLNMKRNLSIRLCIAVMLICSSMLICSAALHSARNTALADTAASTYSATAADSTLATCSGDHSGYTLLPADGKLADGKYYIDESQTIDGILQLTSDVKISGAVQVELCLNGYMLKGTGKSIVLTVENGASFALHDCNGTQQQHRFNEGDNGVWQADKEGSILLDGGVITGGKGAMYGGGIYIYNAEVAMYGGSIVGNTSMDGGGIGGYWTLKETGSKNVFSLYGGLIAGNVSTGYLGGGGVLIATESASAKFTMTGGTISDNIAGSGGGAIICGADANNLASFEMSGGVIKNNTATAETIWSSISGGGGVYLDQYGVFSMSGGSIIANKVTGKDSRGGGVYVHKGPNAAGLLEMSGKVSVTGNTLVLAAQEISDNVFLKHYSYDGKEVYITIAGALDEASEIGVSAGNTSAKPNRQITKNWSAKMSGKNPNDYFQSDDANLTVVLPMAPVSTELSLHRHVYKYRSTTLGNKIEEVCNNGCDHRETLTLSLAAAQAFVYTGLAVTPAVTMTYSSGWAADKDHEATFEQNIGAGDAYASVTFGGGTAKIAFVIEKAPLTVTSNNKSIFYGEAPSASGATFDGFVSGESETTLSGALSYSYNYSQGGAAGNYTITPKGLTSDNYKITFVSGTLTVKAKEIAIDWCSDDFTYNGLDQKVDVTASYLDVNGSTVSLTVSSAEFKNYSINGVAFSVSFANNETNYKLPDSVTKTYNIKKLAVSVKANDSELTYGDSLPTLGWSYVNGSAHFIMADNITLTVTTDATSTSAAGGAYRTQITALINDNYTLSYAVGTMTVNKRAITVTIDNKTSIYGSTLEAPTASVTSGSIVDGDTEVYILSTNATQTSDIGDDYAIAGTAENANYDITFVPAIYSVTAKTLTTDMVEGIASVVYNGQAQEPTVTVSDADLLKDTDYELAFSGNTNAGTATITITATTNGNYTGSVTRTFTIQKADYDMSGIAFEDKTVVHNGTAFGIEITGELPSNVKVTYSENETVAGIYTITATFDTTSGNYNVPAAMTATLTIRYDKQEQPGDDGEGGTVIIESPEGIDPSHKLSANDVTDNYSPAIDVESTIGKNQEIKQVYSVKLLDSNNVAVQPEGLLTIRLLLAENYRNLTELKVYVMDGATMTELTATRDGNYLVFSTAQLAEYAIVGEVPDNGLSVGAIVCIVLACILILLLLLLLILFLLRKDKSQGFRAYCAGLFKKDSKNAKNKLSDELSATRAKKQKSAENDENNENDDDLKE